MKPFNALLIKAGKYLLPIVLSALGGFLSRILKPLFAWVTFRFLSLLIHWTHSDELKSLYKTLHDSYYRR